MDGQGLEEPARDGPVALTGADKGVSGLGKAFGGPEPIGPVKRGGIEAGTNPGNGAGLVDRFGIGPGNDDGIGFWPPKPEEMVAVKKAAVAAGLVSGKKRGPKPKTVESLADVPGPGLE
jgi:hypothetical protein